MNRPPLDAATLRAIAVEASADPRTVARRLAGKRVRPLPAQRIDLVLKARGLATPPTIVRRRLP
jgi:hypothetical protein